MARILRDECRWAHLKPTRERGRSGLWPVLVLSHDVFNERSGAVIGRVSPEELALVVEGLVEIIGV